MTSTSNLDIRSRTTDRCRQLKKRNLDWGEENKNRSCYLLFTTSNVLRTEIIISFNSLNNPIYSYTYSFTIIFQVPLMEQALSYVNFSKFIHEETEIQTELMQGTIAIKGRVGMQPRLNGFQCHHSHIRFSFGFMGFKSWQLTKKNPI